MIFARDKNGEPVLPMARATCPECGAVVQAKCGELVSWHWAHLPGPDHICRYAGETEWHLDWKWWAFTNGCQIETIVAPRHRADVLTRDGNVIELQSKSLNADDVRAREAAYGSRLRWLYRVDAKTQERFHWTKQLDNGAHGFYFRRGPKGLALPTRNLHLDIEGDRIYRVRITLIDKETEYGVSKRMLGQAWPSSREELFDIPAQASAADPDIESAACTRHPGNHAVTRIAGLRYLSCGCHHAEERDHAA